jgi:hypothetical protein
VSVALHDSVKYLVVSQKGLQLLSLGFVLVGSGRLDELEDVAEGNHLLLKVEFEILKDKEAANIVEN